MAILQPITCIRPRPDLAERIATGPHSAMSKEAIRRKVRENPYSYSRIVHPRALVGDDPCAYQRAAGFLRDWLQEGRMLEDNDEAFYLYRLEIEGHAQSGLVGRTPIDEILSGKVHAHETIRESKLQDLAEHIEECGVQIGGPILMACRAEENMDQWILRQQEKKPLYDFISENGVHNQIWKIHDPEDLAWVRREMDRCGDLYIADGHHRVMAAVDICRRRRLENPDYTGKEPWNYLACVCFPDSQLKILPYARIVEGMNGSTGEEILQRIGDSFQVTPCDRTRTPEKRGEIVMCLGEERYLLTFHEELRPQKKPDCLDVAVLQERILRPILGIDNPRNNPRLEFAGGTGQEKQVVSCCRKADTIGFLMFPTSMEELFAVADADAVMPPKSTWFEPKLCNGLFLYRI